MNLFVVTLSGKRKGELTADLLAEHVEHLRLKTKQGKVKLCGPFSDNSSAIQVFIASDIDEATQLIEEDPFIKNRYYQKYQIKELFEANESNNWLMDHNQTNENVKQS